MSHFTLRCRNCGKTLTDTYCAFCEHCADALLVNEYSSRFQERGGEGVWRFNWLPVYSPDTTQSGPVVYRSRGLAVRLGIENLYIAFNGYWPEKDAGLETCTFKEFEAAVVLQNARDNGIEGLIVASAGNTARAFAHLSAVTGYPVVIIVPRMCLPEMWYLRHSIGVPTIAVSDGDYSDSIDVARRIALVSGFPFEGGVKNPAKRDGLGLVARSRIRYEAAAGHYFQAVGSGAGASASGRWRAVPADGRFGTAPGPSSGPEPSLRAYGKGLGSEGAGARAGRS
jgi:cysteate synthase